MDVQESYNMTKLRFIRAAVTRWLLHRRACSRLFDRYTAILDCLDALYDKKKEAAIFGLRNMLTDKKTIAAAVVMCDMRRPVGFFSDYLQGDIHFSRVNTRLQNLKDELEHMTERFQGIVDGHQDPDLYLNRLSDIWREIDDRTTLARRLRDVKVFTIEQIVAELAFPMVHKLIFELEDGFRCSPVLSGFQVFEMKDVPTTVEAVDEFGQVEIRHLADHYGSAKEDVFRGNRNVAQHIFPAHVIIKQFSAFKHTLSLMRQRSTDEQLSDAGFLLQQFLGDPLLQRNYSAMNYLIILSCLIPSSTACVERLFSLMNTVVTKLRSSLGQTSVDCIMRIVSEGKSHLTDEELRKAVDRFRTMKTRDIDF